MRGFPVLGAAAVAILIGGCGPRQGGGEQGANRAAAAAAPAAQAPAPTKSGSAEPAAPRASAAFEPQRGTAIPAPFLGVYDRTLGRCSGASQERTTITPGELRFHETIGKVRSVLLRRENELEVDADYQGEGEYWRSNRLLTLSEGGARLIMDGDGTRPAMIRVRCPAGAG
jgi:ferric-dicitrate binding protein FerR (iron transport regulator)